MIIPPVLWAGNNIVGKSANDFIGPFSLAFYRWLIASGIILIFAAKPLYESRALLLRHCKILILLGVCGTGLFNTLLYLGLTITSANNSSIILSSLPVAIIGLNYLIGQERASGKQMLGLIIALLGVAWVIGKGDLGRIINMDTNPGDLIIVGSVLSWALYSVLLKNWRPPELASLPFLAIQFLIGTLFVLPFFLYEQATHAPILWGKETYLMIAYVVVFPSLFAYYFWQQGVAMGGANLAGLMTPTISLFTALFSYLFLHETLNSVQLVGASLIVMGVLIAFIGPSRARYNG